MHMVCCWVFWKARFFTCALLCELHRKQDSSIVGEACAQGVDVKVSSRGHLLHDKCMH